MATAPEERVNCRVLNLANGSKQLVFTIAGTDRCVGEMLWTGDPQYLLTASQLVSEWAAIERRTLIAPRSVRRINGG
jgi:hypothetical protein